MKRLATLAAALLLAAPMLAADAPKTDPQPAAAPQDSPLVAAAKKAAKKRTGKVTVITNATLVKENEKSRLTTTDSQTAITLPSPDAALLAMQAKANQPQAKPAASPQPAAYQAQSARAARAEDNGPYSETPQLDERTLATAQTQQVGTVQTEEVGTAQTQQATTAQAQTGQQPTTAQSTSPDSMTKKP
jgi:hypothetical protein